MNSPANTPPNGPCNETNIVQRSENDASSHKNQVSQNPSCKEQGAGIAAGLPLYMCAPPQKEEPSDLITPAQKPVTFLPETPPASSQKSVTDEPSAPDCAAEAPSPASITPGGATADVPSSSETIKTVSSPEGAAQCPPCPPQEPNATEEHAPPQYASISASPAPSNEQISRDKDTAKAASYHRPPPVYRPAATEYTGAETSKNSDSATSKSAKAKPQTAPASFPPFSQTHPVLHVEQSLPPSVGSRIFNAFALSPFIVLTVMYLLQTLFSLNTRELWFSDEIRHADAFRNLLEHGKWLILEMNGAAYPDKPPLYFWFLRGLYEVLRTDGPMLYFTAAAISGLLYLWAALGLGKYAGRVDKSTNFAAGIILLSTGYVMGTLHYARMDLLFSALIVGSHILLYRAVISARPNPVGMVAGFALAGLAVLVKGPLGLAMPLCTLLLFILWHGKQEQIHCVIISAFALLFGLLPGSYGLFLAQRFGHFPGATALPLEWSVAFLALPLTIGLLLFKFLPHLRIATGLSLLLMCAAFVLNGATSYFQWPLLYTLPVCALGLLVIWQVSPQRFFRLDFYIGLGVGVLIPCLWLAAIYWQTGNLDFILNSLIKKQVLERALDTFHHKEAWYYYLIRLPLMLLPWVILVLFLPWRGFLGKRMREAMAASRRPEAEGLAYLWSLALSSLLLLSLLSGKILIYLLPALPAFAILGARALLGFSGGKAVLFRYAMAGLLLLSGLLILLASLMLFDVLPVPFLENLPQWRLETNGGFFVVAVIFLLTAALIGFALRSSRPEGVLLYVALGATALGFPLAGLVAPAFDAVLSPKDQALLMRAYIDKGYTPASYNVYGGTYSFYTNHAITELKKQEDILPLAAQGKLVLAMRGSSFDAWQERPACLTEVHRQWIESKEYVLLACPPIEDIVAAPLPYKPGPDPLRELARLVGIELPVKATKPPTQKKFAPVPTPEAAPPAQTSPAPASQKEAQPAPPLESAPPPAPEKETPMPAPTPESGPATENAPPEDASPAPASEPAPPSESAPPPAPEKENPMPAPTPESGPATKNAPPEDTSPAPAPEPKQEIPAPESLPLNDIAKEEAK